jgi:hypothetical protein
VPDIHQRERKPITEAENKAVSQQQEPIEAVKDASESESVNEENTDPLAALDRDEAQAALAAADPEAYDVNSRAASSELKTYLTSPNFPRKNADNEWYNHLEWGERIKRSILCWVCSPRFTSQFKQFQHTLKEFSVLLLE